ncbi:hypothetical protein HanPI659440_Chr03g0100411 [Helianthus annuus]|nr:hypothetical protein HanPI659440_Chr03g0100411 [Helianthus annuus]
MAKFLRESRIGNALSDKTVIYESHVRAFWNTTRYEESDKMIHSVLRKKDEKGKDIDVEFKFGVGDLRRVLDLKDSDNDPTIMSERLAKGLWCRMGFTGHINGKMTKSSFSKAYRYLMHCMVHSLSPRKGAYDEISDYIMNIITSLVLNRQYNISQVIFEYMKENSQAKGDRYIMYPRFIMMMINDQFKDLPKSNNDIMDLRNMSIETINRITKEDDERTIGMICKISNPEYVAPEDDKWRHENSDSDNENEKMSELKEKKTRWWFEKEKGKTKRKPKSSPTVSIPKNVEKGPSEEPQQRLVDETVLEPSVVIEQGIGLLSQSFESYLKRNEEVAAQMNQESSTHAESVIATEPEGEVQDDSSEDDSEAT